MIMLGIILLMRDGVAAPLSQLPIGRASVARLVTGMTVSALRGITFRPLRLGGLD